MIVILGGLGILVTLWGLPIQLFHPKDPIPSFEKGRIGDHPSQLTSATVTLGRLTLTARGPGINTGEFGKTFFKVQEMNSCCISSCICRIKIIVRHYIYMYNNIYIYVICVYNISMCTLES